MDEILIGQDGWLDSMEGDHFKSFIVVERKQMRCCQVRNKVLCRDNLRVYGIT